MGSPCMWWWDSVAWGSSDAMLRETCGNVIGGDQVFLVARRDASSWGPGSVGGGALNVTGGAYFGDSVCMGSSGILFVTNNTPGSSSGGALNVAGGALFSDNVYIATTSSTTGILTVNNNTQSTGANSGALRVTGGAYIGQNLYVDIGNVILKNTAAGLAPGPSNGYGALQVAGGASFGNSVYMGTNATLTVANTTQSTSATTGALRVSGGVGILGNVNIGNIGAPYVPSISTTTGALIVNGGVGIQGNTYIGGNLNVIGNVNISSVLSTQGLMYEATNSISTFASNGFSISYSTGGIFYLPTATSIGANMTMIITNIPTDITKRYTFTVLYYQATTRYYINQVRLSDTAGIYILGTSSTYGTPFYSGGPPALTGTTASIFIQTFTVFSFGATRYVITNVSSSTTT